MTPALRDVHKALGEYSKALDRVRPFIHGHSGASQLTLVQKYKDKPLSPADHYTTSSQEQLVNRAIGMHFLREGQFAVAANFLQESLESELHQSPQIDRQSSRTPELLRSEILQKQFAEMYHILDEMKGKKNLLPATVWARANSTALEARGSNLEFDLVRLRFIWLFFAGEDASHGNVLALRQQSALAYARKEFGSFQDRYLTEIQQLIGAMAFCPNLDQSPYRQIFYGEDAWESLATSFTREFCSLLGLSADSPMYIAATAGAIALPTLQKLRVIMEKKRTEWTTHNELPVSELLAPCFDLPFYASDMPINDIILRSRFLYHRATGSILSSFVLFPRNRRRITILR